MSVIPSSWRSNTAEDWAEVVKDLWDDEVASRDGAVRVRVKVSRLDQILLDERLKTQHDTGTSGGYYAPEVRDQHETHMFGSAVRPVYGYVDPHAVGGKECEAHIYGKVMIGLRAEVSARTTVTFGDSLYETDPPAPLPLGAVSSSSRKRVADAVSVPWGGKKDVRQALKQSYVEAQIHGGVSLKDVAFVQITRSDYKWLSQSSRDLLEDQAVRYGFQIRKISDDDLSLYAGGTPMNIQYDEQDPRYARVPDGRGGTRLVSVAHLIKFGWDVRPHPESAGMPVPSSPFKEG
jgi:Protein of unknown function (DUF3626)